MSWSKVFDWHHKYKEANKWKEKPHNRWPTSRKKGNVRQTQENVNIDHYPMAVRELQ